MAKQDFQDLRHFHGSFSRRNDAHVGELYYEGLVKTLWSRFHLYHVIKGFSWWLQNGVQDTPSRKKISRCFTTNAHQVFWQQFYVTHISCLHQVVLDLRCNRLPNNTQDIPVNLCECKIPAIKLLSWLILLYYIYGYNTCFWRNVYVLQRMYCRMQVYLIINICFVAFYSNLFWSNNISRLKMIIDLSCNKANAVPYLLWQISAQHTAQ